MPRERPGKRREVMEYVESQIRDPEVQATHAAWLDTKRLGRKKYELWEVTTSDGEEWWVFTNITNLYSKKDHANPDVAFSLHLGLMQRIMADQERHAPQGSPAERDRLAGAWRRWEQASQALDAADEAEEFMAVGMRCREALLTFGREVAGPEWVPEGQETPKRDAFVAWAELVADRVAKDRQRALLKGMARLTWAYLQNLKHDQEATVSDGIMAVLATADVLGIYGMALVRHERGVPDRCPRCGSYRLDTEYRPELPGRDPYITYCQACDWETAPPPEDEPDDDMVEGWR